MMTNDMMQLLLETQNQSLSCCVAIKIIQNQGNFVSKSSEYSKVHHSGVQREEQVCYQFLQNYLHQVS